MAFNWQSAPQCEPDLTPWLLVAALAVPALIGGVEILKRIKAKREQRRRREAIFERLAASLDQSPPAGGL